jgi:hypothetical protein
MATLNQLLPTAYNSQTGTAWASTTVGNIDEGVASADGAYIQSGNNSTSTIWYDITDMNSNFVKMITLTYRIKYAHFNRTDDTGVLLIRIVASNKTTNLTNEMTVATNPGSTYIDSGNISFTGVSTTATKAQWDGALLQIRTTHSASKGADGHYWRIDAVEANGTYNAAPTVALGSPADASTVTDTTPDLTFTGTDTESEDIRYNVQVDTDNTFPVATSTDYDADASVSGPTDSDSVWTSPENVYDASPVSFGYTTTVGTSTSNALSATGTNASGSGGIDYVQLLASFRSRTSGQAATINLKVEHDTETLLSNHTGTNSTLAVVITTAETITAPSGGWTWTKIQNLKFTAWYTGSGGLDIYSVWVRVYPTTTMVVNATSGTDSGFSGSPDNTDPFASGQAVTYTVQSALSADTYYWRVRGIDPTGSNTYGAWATTRSFTVSAGTTLVVADVSSSATLDTSNPVQKHTLAVAELSSSATLDVANPTQKHTLSVAEVSSGATLDPVVVTTTEPAINLTVADVISGATLDPVIVTVKYSLASNDVLSGATLDPVSLTQKHTLSLEDIVASTLLDAVEISSTLPTINLVVAELLSETTLDTANLTQKHTLSLVDVTSSTTLDPTNLTQKHALAIQEVTSSATLDPVDLVEAEILTVNDATSSATLDTANPTQKHVVTGNDVTSSTTLEVTNPVQKHTLTVNDVASEASLEAVVVSAYEPELGWYNEAWEYRVKITVDAAKVAANVTDFPVYVDLSNLPSGFHSNVNQTDARDIRVTTADAETEVPREVVFYDAATDTGELHFKAPSLSSSTDTDFYIYYGNTAATEPATNATYGRNNVWSNSYAAVWHMSENPAGDAPQIIDSTGSGYNATTRGSMASGDLVAGKVGRSIDFDGSNDQAGVTRGSSLEQAAVTVSTWVKLDANTPTSGGANVQLFTPVSHEDTNKGYALNIVSSNYGTSGVNNEPQWFTGNGSSLNLINANMSLDTTNWYYLTGTGNGSNVYLYVNAVQKATASATTISHATTKSLVFSGYSQPYPTLTERCFNGKLDEVRVSTVLRGATWIETEYNNQSVPSTFYEAGTEETQSGSSSLTVADAISSATLDNVSITQKHTLSVNDLTSSATLDATNLSQHYTLTVNEATSATTLDAVNLTQATSLSVNDVNSTASLDPATLTQKHIVTGNEVNSATTLDAANLTQKHNLVVADLTSSASLDAVELTEAEILTVADATSSSSLDSANLTQKHTLTLADVLSATTLDTANPVQKHTLVVADALSSTTLDNVSLSSSGSLSVVDATSASTLDAANLIQKHQLTVADVASTTTIDTPTLLQAYTLTLEDVVASTLLDAVEVSATAGTINLIVADLLSETTLDAVETTTGKFTLTPASITSTTTLKRVKLTGIPINGAEIIILTNGSIAVKLDNYTYELI